MSLPGRDAGGTTSSTCEILLLYLSQQESKFEVQFEHPQVGEVKPSAMTEKLTVIW